MNLHYHLLGYRTLSTDASNAADLLDLCRRRAIPYARPASLPSGDLRLTFSLANSRSVADACLHLGIPFALGRPRGLPVLLGRITRRPGLAVGLLVGIFLYLSASSVVWDIRITGNEQISDRAVEETLAAAGLTVGTSLRGFRADVVENRALLLDDRLAWLSVNRRGTVAHVEVRESAGPRQEESDAPADMIAARGGIIERVELEAGNVLVSAGETVSPGDLLVSGIFDSEPLGYRLTRARARIYARTVREITVRIPLEYEQKVYMTAPDSTLSDICQEKRLIFFGKSIKFSKKTGNEGVLCDTIEGERPLGPLSGVGFPISVRTVWYLPYTVETATRTYPEAEELAYVELARHIAAIPGGAELLGKTVTTAHTPDALILTCTLTCVEDIGEVREIEVGS